MKVSARSPFLLLALCVLAWARTAGADVEGPHISFSPHAGAAVWLRDLDLAEDVVYGGRVAVMLSAYVGAEGTVNITPTHTDTAPQFFDRVTHLGADAIINLAPYGIINPYITGGWAQLHFDPANGSEATFNAWEAGGGFKIRLTESDGRRVDLRLDARNVFADLDAPFPSTRTQNALFTSVGLTFSMGTSARDSDGDGVPNRNDDCPDTPALAVVDAHGCPLDSDGDGVFDGLDHCGATLAGASVDLMGCPFDTDRDGVFDGIDACADTPGGVLVDTQGCPLDSDGDGVFDGLDQCPGSPAGVTVNAQGCVADSDGDGVTDDVDLCPGTPGGLAVDPEGCPVVTSQEEGELLDTGVLRLDTVHFASAKADIKPESFHALDEVGEILAKWPQLRIEIAGHTDSRGPEEFNLQLSERRAQAVFNYLAQRFPNVRTGQFSIRGYGESQPVGSNNSALGRARNRRVEFRVLNREMLRR